MSLKRIPYDRIEPLIKVNLSMEEESKTKQLIAELRTAKNRGYIKKSELELICKWKSPRAIRLIKSNSEKTINKLTKKAFATRSEKIKLELLTQLNGVSVPMASAILMLLNTKRYGVIDIRVWQLLYQVGTVTSNPKGVNFTFKEWYRYLVIIRYFSKKMDVSTRDIERTLFYVHKEYQDGKLYDTVPKK